LAHQFTCCNAAYYLQSRYKRTAPGARDIKANAKRGADDKSARADAEAVVDRWNEQLAAGRDMLWSPTIRAAMLTGTPWLDVFCPGDLSTT
jgi:hypothetical protein